MTNETTILVVEDKTRSIKRRTRNFKISVFIFDWIDYIFCSIFIYFFVNSGMMTSGSIIEQSFVEIQLTLLYTSFAKTEQ